MIDFICGRMTEGQNGQLVVDSSDVGLFAPSNDTITSFISTVEYYSSFDKAVVSLIQQLLTDGDCPVGCIS